MAFINCANLKEIDLKGTQITILSIQVFAYCNNLMKVVFPEELLTIKHSAFAYCISLEEINLPEKFQVIEQFVFGGCIKLKKVNFNNQIQSIYHIAFDGCIALSSVSLPSSLIQLGAVGGTEIFSGCASLSDVEYLGTSPDTINCFGNVFGTSVNPENLYLPNVEEPVDPTIKEKWNKFLKYDWTDKIKYKQSMPSN